MALSAATLASEYSDAVAADRPLLVSFNGLLDANKAIQWHDKDVAAVGYPGVTDRTDSDYPTSNLYSGLPWKGSKATDQTVGTYYLWMDLDDRTIDTIAIKFGVLVNNANITIKFSDKDDFGYSGGDDTQTVATFASVSSGSRVGDISLDHGSISSPVQYTSIRYVQIAVALAAGTWATPPEVGEIYLGQRRQLAANFLEPYDEQPRGSIVQRPTPANHQRTPIKMATGFQDREGNYMAVEGPDRLYGFDDAETIRGIYTDCDYGARAVAFWQSPGTDSDDFVIGHLNPLSAPYRGWQDRNWNFGLEEQAPFKEAP